MTTKDQVIVSIKKMIKERGLTIAELAARMGSSQSSLSQTLISGNPTLEMLERIATALGVDVKVLFESTGNEIHGIVQYKDRTHKIDSLQSLKRLLSEIEEV